MSKLTKLTRGLLVVTAANIALSAASGADGALEYRILATSKTSTMDKEINEAAADGYRFAKAMGGKTANGGQEVVVAMVKEAGAAGRSGFRYKLLATSKTSTMQKEMQSLADEGYEYVDQTVFQTAFGGREVVVIMEADPAQKARSNYRLLATTKTSTMQKELQAAGSQGYVLFGLTVGKTEIGGDEIVAVLRKN
ncbi:MAG: hypothetical protein LAP61_14520 [Acidobacteriia bacterium]|nr:hypothetical protein [Terriglobia bacterium]